MTSISCHLRDEIGAISYFLIHRLHDSTRFVSLPEVSRDSCCFSARGVERQLLFLCKRCQEITVVSLPKVSRDSRCFSTKGIERQRFRSIAFVEKLSHRFMFLIQNRY
jgi:hypothetical protein